MDNFPEDRRKISIKSENKDFIDFLYKKQNFIGTTADGIKMAIAIALKNGLEHEDSKKSRTGEDTNIDDAKSFKDIDNLLTVIRSLYPIKYNEITQLDHLVSLVCALADSGIEYIIKNTEYDKENIGKFKVTEYLRIIE
jgi:hypothetical protein